MSGLTNNLQLHLFVALPSDLHVSTKEKQRMSSSESVLSLYKHYKWHSDCFTCHNLLHLNTGMLQELNSRARAWWWTVLWSGLCSLPSSHRGTPVGPLWSVARWCLSRGHRPPQNACLQKPCSWEWEKLRFLRKRCMIAER